MTGRNGWLLWMMMGPVALFGACEAEIPAATASAVQTAAAVTPGGSPLGSATAPDSTEEAFAGTVIERLAAGSYTYLRVETHRGAHWVAVMGSGESEGTRVDVRVMAVKADFTSRRLDRTFDRLLFATVEPIADSLARR